MADFQHRAWLEFVRKAMDLPIEYSAADLERFKKIATIQYPALVRVIDAYIQLIKQSMHSSEAQTGKLTSKPPLNLHIDQAPLLDLLRDNRLFPQNKDIASFAQRVLPNMRSYRFDKKSKSDVAMRIIEHLEILPPKTRSRLEASMRDALSTPTPEDSQRKSFMSKWENIIKGIDIG